MGPIQNDHDINDIKSIVFLDANPIIFATPTPVNVFEALERRDLIAAEVAFLKRVKNTPGFLQCIKINGIIHYYYFVTLGRIDETSRKNNKILEMSGIVLNHLIILIGNRNYVISRFIAAKGLYDKRDVLAF